MGFGPSMHFNRECQFPANALAYVPDPGSFRYGGLDLQLTKGKATVGSNGDYRLSWTTREDTARFMGYAFTHLSTSELSGKCLRIEGDNHVSDSPRQTATGPSK